MNKAERRSNKIVECMSELLSIYVENKQPIVAEVEILDMHYRMTFDAQDLNAKVDNQKVEHE